MLILGASASHLLQVVTPGTGNLLCRASWVDKISSTDVTPGTTNTADITTATTTTIVAGNASAQRNIQELSIKNTHASTARLLTVQHTDGTTAVPVTPGNTTISLAAGESLHYEDGCGWYVLDVTGTRRSVGSNTGRYLKTTVLTSGTTHILNSLTGKIRIRGVGGGAGGAGCTSVAAAASAGGGGGAGSYAEKVFDVTPGATLSYTIGAAGNGASGAAGGNGGSGTFVVGAVTVTVPGGTGAPVATAVTTLSGYLGGAGGTVPTNGDLNSVGRNGESGVILVVATPVGVSGNGGDSVFGSGGIGRTTVGNGNAGAGFGAGGGGAMTGASAVRTGGNGTAGCWIVDEFAA